MKWLRLPIGGQSWEVALVPPSDPHLKDDDEEVYALTVPEECRIYISEELCHEARCFYLVHELEHAINSVSGATHEMGRKCRTKADHDAFEERIVRLRTSVLWPLLQFWGVRFFEPEVYPS
jgi:hypothetical protein